jgi:hypothetical protein
MTWVPYYLWGTVVGLGSTNENRKRDCGGAGVSASKSLTTTTTRTTFNGLLKSID